MRRGIYTVLYKDNLDEFNTFIGNPFLNEPYNGIREEVQTAVYNFLRSSYDNSKPMVVIEMTLGVNNDDNNHGVAFYFDYYPVDKDKIESWAWSFSEPVEPKEFIEELNHVVNIKLI